MDSVFFPFAVDSSAGYRTSSIGARDSGRRAALSGDAMESSAGIRIGLADLILLLKFNLYENVNPGDSDSQCNPITVKQGNSTHFSHFYECLRGYC